jgi:hypothetical protein
VITPAAPPRQSWDAEFRRIAELEDDAMLDLETATTFDEMEWEWPDE